MDRRGLEDSEPIQERHCYSEEEMRGEDYRQSDHIEWKLVKQHISRPVKPAWVQEKERRQEWITAETWPGINTKRDLTVH